MTEQEGKYGRLEGHRSAQHNLIQCPTRIPLLYNGKTNFVSVFHINTKFILIFLQNLTFTEFAFSEMCMVA